MEFFAIAQQTELDGKTIQEQVTVARMGEYCDTIVVLDGNDEAGNIGTVWGEFPVQRQIIRGGVRFALTTCPNALAWTITSGFPPVPDGVVIHGTINRTEHDEDFIESIVEFLETWRLGLEKTQD